MTKGTLRIKLNMHREREKGWRDGGMTDGEIVRETEIWRVGERFDESIIKED